MSQTMAVVFLLAIAALSLWLVRGLLFTISGKLKPLSPPLGQGDPASRIPVAFIPGSEAGATPPFDQFDRFRDNTCEIHRKPFCALTVLKLMRPAHQLDFDPNANAVVKGRCFLLSCVDCVAEARRWRAFVWRRDKHSQHPAWASAALYPWLLKNQYFKLEDEIARPHFGGTLPPLALPFGSEDAPGLLSKLSDLASSSEEVSVVPELPEQALREVLRAINKRRQGEAVLLADGVIAIRKGAGSFAVAIDAFYEVSEVRKTVRRIPYDAMSDLALSENAYDVLLGGKKVSNPFVLPERRKRFATALHALLCEMRARGGSQVVIATSS